MLFCSGFCCAGDLLCRTGQANEYDVRFRSNPLRSNIHALCAVCPALWWEKPVLHAENIQYRFQSCSFFWILWYKRPSRSDGISKYTCLLSLTRIRLGLIRIRCEATSMRSALSVQLCGGKSQCCTRIRQARFRWISAGGSKQMYVFVCRSVVRKASAVH